VLVVFVTGGLESKNARMVVDFGQPEMYYDMQVTMGDNTSALRMLSSKVPDLKINNGKLDCVMEYCKTENGEWKFYTVTEGPLGFVENEQGSAESYIVKEGEIIMFRYIFNTTEITGNTTVVNETVTETNSTV
jgi:hypothetical protein